MGLTKRARYKNATLRRQQTSPGTANQRPRRTPIVPTVGAISGSTLPVTFPEAVVYSGILPGWTTTTRSVIAVAVTSPTTVTLTFSGSLVGTSPLTIPFEDPAFRNQIGGYVQPGAYAIA
jgi:hypothetical protein